MDSAANHATALRVQHGVQGDQEKAIGLPVSPLMDRDTKGGMTRSQASAFPLLLATRASCTLAMLLANLAVLYMQSVSTLALALGVDCCCAQTDSRSLWGPCTLTCVSL